MKKILEMSKSFIYCPGSGPGLVLLIQCAKLLVLKAFIILTFRLYILNPTFYFYKVRFVSTLRQ